MIPHDWAILALGIHYSIVHDKRLETNYMFNCRWLVKQMIRIQAVYITMQLLACEIYME